MFLEIPNVIIRWGERGEIKVAQSELIIKSFSGSMVSLKIQLFLQQKSLSGFLRARNQ